MRKKVISHLFPLTGYRDAFLWTHSIKILPCNSTKKRDVHFIRTSENYRSVINNFYSEKTKVVTGEDNDRWIYKVTKKITAQFYNRRSAGWTEMKEKWSSTKQAELGLQKKTVCKEVNNQKLFLTKSISYRIRREILQWIHHSWKHKIYRVRRKSVPSRVEFMESVLSCHYSKCSDMIWVPGELWWTKLIVTKTGKTEQLINLKTIIGKWKGDWNAAFSKCQVIQKRKNEQLSVITPESAQLHCSEDSEDSSQNIKSMNLM